MLEAFSTEFEALSRPESLAERVHQALREKIATGGLVPGQRLTERGLASMLGVSPTPVREAVRRLEQEGLIARSSVRAMTVVEHSEDTLHELLYAEAMLRAAMARFATHKISDNDIERMGSIVDELETRAPSASADVTLALAGQFDDILQSAAANLALDSLVASAGILGRARRTRAVVVMRDQRTDIGLAHLNAHRKIVDALKARDPDKVERLVRDQLLASLSLLLSDDIGDAP